MEASCSSYYGNAPRPTSPLGKTFSLFYHFFVFVVVAAYISNLAAVLVNLNTANTVTSGYTSMEDAVLKGAKICVPGGGSLQAITRAAYPKVKEVSYLGSIADGITMMRNGQCHALVHDYDLAVYQADIELLHLNLES